MSQESEDKRCRGCFPVMLLLFAISVGLSYNLGYEIGNASGQMYQLNLQIKSVERRIQGQP